VTLIAPETILAVFAVFCRVGGCLLIAPGFSSTQIPMRIRLYVALAVSLALSPLLIDTVRPLVGDGSATALVSLLFTELATGLFIGFIARLFFMALQTITVAMTQAIGLSPIPGTVGDDHEQVPALTTLFMLTATTLMFVSGLHIELLRGLLDSYSSLPPGHGFAARLALVDIADQITAAFLVALRIGSPFIIFSIIVNFAIGVTNKLMPQLPVFFIATPFVLVGGLFLLLMTAPDFIEHFEAAFAAWLLEG
jgi:flagellar biosynthetic protein FliR